MLKLLQVHKLRLKKKNWWHSPFKYCLLKHTHIMYLPLWRTDIENLHLILQRQLQNRERRIEFWEVNQNNSLDCLRFCVLGQRNEIFYSSIVCLMYIDTILSWMPRLIVLLWTVPVTMWPPNNKSELLMAETNSSPFFKAFSFCDASLQDLDKNCFSVSTILWQSGIWTIHVLTVTHTKHTSLLWSVCRLAQLIYEDYVVYKYLRINRML